MSTPRRTPRETLRSLARSAWRARRWWLWPLLAAALLLILAWVVLPERPAGQFIYGRG
jgi:hypothetical protein